MTQSATSIGTLHDKGFPDDSGIRRIAETVHRDDPDTKVFFLGRQQVRGLVGVPCRMHADPGGVGPHFNAHAVERILLNLALAVVAARPSRHSRAKGEQKVNAAKGVRHG